MKCNFTRVEQPVPGPGAARRNERPANARGGVLHSRRPRRARAGARAPIRGASRVGRGAWRSRRCPAWCAARPRPARGAVVAQGDCRWTRRALTPTAEWGGSGGVGRRRGHRWPCPRGWVRARCARRPRPCELGASHATVPCACLMAMARSLRAGHCCCAGKAAGGPGCGDARRAGRRCAPHDGTTEPRAGEGRCARNQSPQGRRSHA